MAGSIMSGQSNFPSDSYPATPAWDPEKRPLQLSAALCSSSSKKRRGSQPLIMRSLVAGPLPGPSAGTNEGYRRRGHTQPQALGLGDKLLVRLPVDSAETVSPGFLGSLLQWSKPCNCRRGSIQQRLTGKWREREREREIAVGNMSRVHPQGESMRRQVLFVRVGWTKRHWETG